MDLNRSVWIVSPDDIIRKRVMLDLMPLGLFDDIYVFSNTASSSDDPWSQMGVAKENIFKPDEQGLQHLGRIMRSDTFSRKTLVVFDNVTGSRIFRTSRLYIGMHTGTHIHRISLFSLTRLFRSLPRSCRINVSDRRMRRITSVTGQQQKKC
jgi:hypothetical protein